MLIKAPIGSGKSFLFFDGPIYGLYKYSSRNILNSKSKDGYIKLIVEVNNTLYFISRQIKKGKSKDSCESKLFILEGTLPDFSEYKPLENDIDIEKILKEHPGLKRDEVTFKNETDLQQNLQTFLPPREVIMNTIFLMQDSDNIFELTPVERLTILKNVFNLLGIDEAKDILADKKREIRYKIKSKTDISSYDQKLKNKVQNYLSTFNTTKVLLENKIDTTSYQPFFDERTMIEEKVNITDFSLTDFPVEREEKLQTYVEQEKSQIQKFAHQLESIQEQIRQEQGKIKEQQSIETELNKSIQELEKKIQSIDEKKIDTLKKQKQTLLDEQKKYEDQLQKKEIRAFISKQWSGHISKESDITIASIYIEIQQIISKGKTISESIKHIQAQIKNEELQSKNEADKIKTQTQHLEEKIQVQEDQLKKIVKTLDELEKNIDTQATFACEKIKDQCPFIKVINKKTFDQLDQQKSTFIEQQVQITTILEKLTAERKALNAITSTQDTKKIEALEKEQKKAEKTIESIKTFLSDIQYKQIEIFYNEYLAKEKESKQLDQQISTMEQESKKIEERKLQLQKAIIQKESLEKQIIERIKDIADKEQQRKILEEEKEKANPTTTLQIEKNALAMKQISHDMEMLVNEFKEHKLERQKLEEQETILGNLYNIFSKELLLLVLQDHLPILNDIINNYLAQIVDYQISLQLNKSDSEKLELEAKIIDQKGERDTKSLSGGQRIILKLIRTLAISSYINSPILFLDETINNLDADTVGKVADMLEDFVKQKDIKLYTITHSQQIQQMDIRDEIIEIDQV